MRLRSPTRRPLTQPPPTGRSAFSSRRRNVSSPTVDTQGTGIAHGTTSVGVAISTSAADELICLLVQTDYVTATPVTSVSGGGLTWTKRVTNATSPPAFY